MQFSEVIGQSEARERLLTMVRENRLPHAMLLCGPEGSGKMALAMAMASYLLCRCRPKQDEGPSMFGFDEPEPEPQQTASDSCGDCPQCAMLRKWQHPDLHFSYPVIKPPKVSSDHKMESDDFAREWQEMLLEGPYFSMDRWLQGMNAANQQAVIGVGEATALQRKLALKSSQGGYKVSIIWLPERMNGECANKLLKLLEEPPTQTVFIMVCEEPERLLETITSRTQRIDIRRIDEKSMTQALQERRGLDHDTARRMARSSGGNWLKAMEELDAGSENRQFLDLFILFMRKAYMRDIRELRKWSDTVAGFGREKQRRLLRYFLRMMRENFMYNFRQDDLCYMTAEEENFARNFARFINEANVIRLSELFEKAHRDIGQNANPKMVFFDISLSTIMLLIAK